MKPRSDAPSHTARLKASFAAILALTGFIAVFSVIQLANLKLSAADLGGKPMPSLQALLSMKSDLTQLWVDEKQHVAARDEMEKSAYERLANVSLGVFQTKLEQYEKLISKPEEKRVYQEVVQLWERHLAQRAKVRELLSQNSGNESGFFIESESWHFFPEVSDRFDRLLEINIDSGIASGRIGDKIYSTSRLLILCLLGGSLVIAFAILVMRKQVRHAAELREEIAIRKETEETLQQSKEVLSQLSSHQEQIREDERKRIASEIHDDLGQNLLALRMDVALLHARTGAHSRLNKKVGHALHTIDATMKNVRGIIGNLRPAVLNLGLQAAVEWQLNEFERINRIRCKLLVHEKALDVSLDDDRTVVIFRILQEALANTARHAQATEIQVELSVNNNRLSMTVKDNGKGFQPVDRRKANTFGLIGITERIKSIGGKFIIDSRNGTALSISIPLEKITLAWPTETGGGKALKLEPARMSALGCEK